MGTQDRIRRARIRQRASSMPHHFFQVSFIFSRNTGELTTDLTSVIMNKQHFYGLMNLLPAHEMILFKDRKERSQLSVTATVT